MHNVIAMEWITDIPLIIIIMGLEKNVMFLTYSPQGNLVSLGFIK
jgi:hypothetical protein